MAALYGQTNATLKDLTRIVEDTLGQTRPQLLPKIATKIDAANESYVKVPVNSHVPWPRKLEGPMQVDTAIVGYVEYWEQETFCQRLEWNSDLVKDAKAFEWGDFAAEASAVAAKFKDYLASQILIGAINGTTPTTGDGVQFYGSTHKYAGISDAPSIDNTLSITGSDIASIFTDIGKAQAKLLTFQDNAKRVLNSADLIGPGNLLVQCPAAMYLNIRAVATQSMIPAPASGSTSSGYGLAQAAMNNVLAGTFEPYPDAYLDGGSITAKYLVHYISQARKPLAWINDYDPRVTVFGFGSEFEADKHRVAIIIKQRFHIGLYSFWRSIKVA